MPIIIARTIYKIKNSPPKVRTPGGGFLIYDSSPHYLLAVEDVDALRQLNIEDGTLNLWPCKSLFSILFSLFSIYRAASLCREVALVGAVREEHTNFLDFTLFDVKILHGIFGHFLTLG